MRAYLSLTIANLRMYLRNPVASFTLFAVLVVLLLAVKLIVTGQGPHAKLVVVDASEGRSAALLAAIRHTGAFDLTTASEQAAGPLLASGQVDTELVIPAALGTRDAGGRPVPVELGVTYRAGTAGETTLPLLQGVVAEYNERVLGQVPIVSVNATARQARPSGAIDFLLPGVVAFNIVASALMIAVGIFANYKSTGVLRRLKATGISPSIFVLAHATASFLLGMAQTAAILIVASLLFSVHLDLPALFLLVVLGYLVFLALGLAIGGWINDAQRATAVAQAVAFPLILLALLSAVLPAGVTAVTRWLPISYVTDGLQQLTQGASLGTVAPDVLWLVAWGAVLLVAAGRVFRWD